MLLPAPVGDGLEDGGEGCDPDAGAHQHRVLRPVDVAARRPERSINHDLGATKYLFTQLPKYFIISKISTASPQAASLAPTPLP